VTDLGKYHLDPAKDDILRIEIERVESINKDEKGEKKTETKKAALLVGVRKPDAIDIKNSWGTLEFRRESSSPAGPPGMPPRETWKMWRGDKSYAVDDTAVQALINSLTAQNQVEGFVDDPARKGQLIPSKPDAVVR